MTSTTLVLHTGKSYVEEHMKRSNPGIGTFDFVGSNDFFDRLKSGESDLGLILHNTADLTHVKQLPDSGLFIVGIRQTSRKLNLWAKREFNSDKPGQLLSLVDCLSENLTIPFDTVRKVEEVDLPGFLDSDTGSPKPCVLTALEWEIPAAYKKNLFSQVVTETLDFFEIAREHDMSRPSADENCSTFVYITGRDRSNSLFTFVSAFVKNGVQVPFTTSFSSDTFFLELDGHPEDSGVQKTLEEMQYFSNMLSILGVAKRTKSLANLASENGYLVTSGGILELRDTSNKITESVTQFSIELAELFRELSRVISVSNSSSLSASSRMQLTADFIIAASACEAVVPDKRILRKARANLAMLSNLLLDAAGEGDVDSVATLIEPILSMLDSQLSAAGG